MVTMWHGNATIPYIYYRIMDEDYFHYYSILYSIQFHGFILIISDKACHKSYIHITYIKEKSQQSVYNTVR